MKNIGVAAVVVGLVVGAAQGAVASEPADSPRLARAKDLIADERWAAAIPELRAAVNDRKEQNKDEALFWLAHSQNQAGDLAEAVESIRSCRRTIRRAAGSSRRGRSMIELAQKLGRRDVLWLTAVPPTPPVAPVRRRAAAAAPPRVRARRPSPPAPPAAAVRPGAAGARCAHAAGAAAGAAGGGNLVRGAYLPDTDLRVQALGRLIPTDAPKVIPILRNIALEADNPGAARRAVFVLAQSRNPQAQSTVVDVAKWRRRPFAWRPCASSAASAVRTSARICSRCIRRGNAPVKQQVVFSLGERADTSALLRIVQTENDDELRDAAILTLGRAGGREQLRVLFGRASKDARQAVIRGSSSRATKTG